MILIIEERSRYWTRTHTAPFWKCFLNVDSVLVVRDKDAIRSIGKQLVRLMTQSFGKLLSIPTPTSVFVNLQAVLYGCRKDVAQTLAHRSCIGPIHTIPETANRSSTVRDIMFLFPTYYTFL